MQVGIYYPCIVPVAIPNWKWCSICLRLKLSVWTGENYFSGGVQDNIFSSSPPTEYKIGCCSLESRCRPGWYKIETQPGGLTWNLSNLSGINFHVNGIHREQAFCHMTTVRLQYAVKKNLIIIIWPTLSVYIKRAFKFTGSSLKLVGIKYLFFCWLQVWSKRYSAREANCQIRVGYSFFRGLLVDGDSNVDLYGSDRGRKWTNI